MNQKEFNDLREEAEALRKKGERALTDAERKRAQEIRATLAGRNSRRANPALAEWVTVELAVAADAPPGERELRLLGATGLSNPVLLQVGTLPETSEPVATLVRAPDQAGPRGPPPPRPAAAPAPEVVLPAVVNGQILPGEIDRFRFSARAGQQVVVAVAARSLIPYLADAVPGWFQATVAMRDAAGHELAYADDFEFRPDPVLSCRIPADGEYTVEIKDAIYRGRQDFVYRFAIGELPFVTSVFPLGAARGRPVELELAGWNLGKDRMTFAPDEHAPGLHLLGLKRGELLSNRVRFAVDETGIAETAAAAGPAGQSLAWPATVDGRIARAGERDTYVLDVPAGTTFVAEVFARRLDSPLDSVLTVLDADGRTVAANDDAEDRGEGWQTHPADSRVLVAGAAGGRHRLIVADAQGRGGPAFGYRLRVGLPRPDFELRVVPSALNARAGGHVPLTVHALRRDGFAGEIRLALGRAPGGVALSGAVIPAGADSVQVTLAVPPGADGAVRALEIAGRADIAGRSVEHAAVPADDVMQAFLYRHLVPARELLVAVSGRAPGFRWITRGPVRLVPGQTATLVAETAAGAWLDSLQTELVEPPAGVATGNCSVSRGRILFEVTCDAAAARKGAQGNLIVGVRGQRRNAPAGAPGRNQGQSLGVLPAMPFVIAGGGGTP